MNEYGQFHDGSFDGLWINGKSAHVFLSTGDKRPFTVTLLEVAALSASEFRAGSIVLSVETRESEEISAKDIADLFDLHEGTADEAQVARQLAKARAEKLLLFTIAPSYGAYCLILARYMDLVPRRDWIRRYCLG